jgi:hypothetical protein
MDLWLPGAKRVDAWQDGGSMAGGPPRVIWHSTENDPTKTTAATIADYLNRRGYQVHLVWNPVTGETIQMIPADRAGRGVQHTGYPETNRMGDVCIQIETVAHAAQPFTRYEMKGLDSIMAWLRGLGVPDVWPGGPPPAADRTAHVSSTVWATKGGHYSHSQVPENDHDDPGAIDISKLFATGDDLSAKDVWDYPIPSPWDPKNKTWPAVTVFQNMEQRIRNLEAVSATVTSLKAELDRVVAKLGA